MPFETRHVERIARMRCTRIKRIRRPPRVTQTGVLSRSTGDSGHMRCTRHSQSRRVRAEIGKLWFFVA